MSLVLIITLISLAQLLSYALLDKFKLRPLKWLVLILILATYLFLVPFRYYPPHAEGEYMCGMAAFAFTVWVWFVGGFATIVVHTIYSLLLKRLVVRHRQNN